MKITIGQAENGKEFHLPADVVTSTLVVYGGKGMGKTNLGGVIVEELSRAGLRWSVLDPMGVWWGMRHSKDGKGPEVECLILSGPHGDIPIEPTGGAVVGDLVADEEANVIIDFSRRPNGLPNRPGSRMKAADTAIISDICARSASSTTHGRAMCGRPTGCFWRARVRA